MNDDDAFYAEIREFFLIETKDLLESTESCFLDLEKDPKNEDIVQSIFRLVHNIKGSAKSVGLNSLSEFAHHLENILVKIRNKEMEVSSDIASILLESNDRIKANIEALQEDVNTVLDNSDMIEKIEAILLGENSSVVIEETEKVIEKNIINENLGTILIQENKVSAEDVAKAAKYQESKIGEILVDQGKLSEESLQDALSRQKKVPVKSEEYIRISLNKIDEMVNYFGEQVILQSTLEYAKDDVTQNQDLIQKTVSQLSKITYDLQQTAISLRMVSIKTLFSKLERIVRDSSKSLNKQIEFHKNGEDCELDKNILESIIDPLTHMVRNSVDHGIESCDERVMSGKEEVGNVWLNAYPRGGYFYIEIKDDGQGLDKEKILKKALEKGIIKDASISDSEIYDLIFRSGFSTKETATELSGRGVGMDVVRSSVEKLKGNCYIDSTPGEGSSFTIRLPQTLAIFNGMIIKVNGFQYVVANSDVVEVVPYDHKKSRKISSGAVIDIKGEVVEIIDLNSFLKVRSDVDCDEILEPSLLIVNYKNKKYGLTVDRLVAQQRVVHKPVGVEVREVKGITGGTILGDGKVSLILSPSELLAHIF